VYRSTRALARTTLALALAVSVALCSLGSSVAPAADGAIVYTHESEADFAKQLAAKQVKAVEINKRLRTMRVTLADGSHVLASYPKKQEPQTHHKIRYIAGGVIVLVILIVGGVLLVNRRRGRD